MDSNEQALLFDQALSRHLQQSKALLWLQKAILLSCLDLEHPVGLSQK